MAQPPSAVSWQKKKARRHSRGRLCHIPMFSGKPIIGIVGGIGSGKSFVAKLFAEQGCAVIDADAQVHAAYKDLQVLKILREWWGSSVFQKDGSVDRAAIARRVFSDPAQRKQLEGLIHPWVQEDRRRQMQNLANNAQVVAFVWDTPLLLEAGLRSECDVIVFVEASRQERLRRVARDRQWDEAELVKRENLQWPLDRKRGISDYMIENTADASSARRQVADVLSRVLLRASQG